MYRKGQIVYINLRGKKMSVKKLNYSDKFQEDFLGGRGYNSAILYFMSKIVKPPETAFSADNLICISGGLLAGTVFPSSGRTTVSVWKSPVTGIFCDGNLGGHFGPALKLAGIDCLIIDGALSSPHYIDIYRNGEIVLVPLDRAQWFRGNNGIDHDINSKRKTSDGWGFETLSIGTAGANQVFAATVQCKNRVAGGGGTGAVFGSKYLKAICVSYMRAENIAEFYPKQFQTLSDEAIDKIEHHPVFDLFSKYGTTSLIEIHEGMNYHPTQNWTKSTFKNWMKISAEAVMKLLKRGRSNDAFNADMEQLKNDGELGCRNCPITCSNQLKIEYETLNCLGAKLGVDDLKFITRINSIYMNGCGIDVIQSTSIISALMEMWEKGVSDYEFMWGDTSKIHKFLHTLVYRVPGSIGVAFIDGFETGLIRLINTAKIKIDVDKMLNLYEDIRFLGKMKSYSTVEQVAKLASELFFVNVKGMGVSGVVPSQKNKGVALAVATSTRGGDHLRSLPTLAAYASWYLRSNPLKKIWTLLNTNIRMLIMMKSETKNITNNLWDTYEKVFGVPRSIVHEWRDAGFLTNNKINKGWGSMIKFTQEMYAVSDSLSTCRFISPWRFGIGPELDAEAFMYLTGRTLYWRHLLECGERINAMEKELLYSYGIPIRDSLSPKFFVGKGSLTKKDFDEIKKDYYNKCLYDPNGRPTKVLLYQLLISTCPDETREDIIKTILEGRGL